MIKRLFFINPRVEEKHLTCNVYTKYNYLYISYPEIKGRMGDVFKINDDFFVLINVSENNNMDFFREGYVSIADYSMELDRLYGNQKLWTHCLFKLNENLQDVYMSQRDSELNNKFPSRYELLNALKIINEFVMRTGEFTDEDIKNIESLAQIENSIKKYCFK